LFSERFHQRLHEIGLNANHILEISGLLVWAFAVPIGAIIAIAASGTVGSEHSADSKLSTAEPLLVLELDQLFRSDRRSR